MTGEWLQLEGYGLGKLKPAASNDLYVTPHAARSFASALGYSACVLQERGRHGKGGGGGGGGGGGVECQFYRGSGAELYSRRKKEKGARLLVCLSEGADAAAAAAADERAEDSWELVESECVDKVVAASMCRAQNELSDAHKQHQASLLRQRQITDEFWADLASAPTLTPTSTVSVFEHERWMPFAGWTSPPFPRDTPHFTYEDGTPAPKLHLVSPPRGTRWNPSGPRSKWMHEPPQGSPPAAAAAADASDKSGGWEYAMDFSMTPYRPRCRITDMVRRRKWTRVYVTPAHDGGGRQRSGGGGGGGAAAAEAAEAAAASDADEEEVGEGVAARRSGRQQQQPAYHSDSSSSR
eukprot:Rhum_TRINITY_DN14489_c8_g1::Rhum_TRINITY_DN14489_c8_g1_i1::g.92327::m.92327